jgi:hypothetical protein
MPSHTSVYTWSVTADGTCWETTHTTKTQIVLTITYDNWDSLYDQTAYDYALNRNPCTPIIITDPGFALFKQDPWYITGPGRPGPPYDYAVSPPSTLTSGFNLPPQRRGLDREWISAPPSLVIVEDLIRNVSRRATDEELYERFGIWKCTSANCVQEKKALGFTVDENGNIVAPPTEATPTHDTNSNPSTLTSLVRGSYGRSSLPQPTPYAKTGNTGSNPTLHVTSMKTPTPTQTQT